MNETSTVANAAARVESEIRNDFVRIADLIGLTEEDRVVLIGANRELSRVILALETIGAALDIFREPAPVVAWLRRENLEEPFDGGSPLQLMAAGGRLGVEITLIYLRARLRIALMAAKTC